jgi:hypothetical protein
MPALGGLESGHRVQPRLDEVSRQMTPVPR